MHASGVAFEVSHILHVKHPLYILNQRHKFKTLLCVLKAKCRPLDYTRLHKIAVLKIIECNSGYFLQRCVGSG